VEVKEIVVSTIVFASNQAPATINRRVKQGELSQLATGVYTTDVESEPSHVVKREWHDIVGGLTPGAVITDRSAPTGGPVDGVLYLSHDARERQIELPGLTVLARRGAGPLDGDIPLPGGLHQASTGRALAENTRASRARKQQVRRTLDEPELGDWIDRLAQTHGEQRLAAYRVQAEEVAETVGATPTGVSTLSRMVGVALGTQRSDTPSKALAARQARLPYDHDRVEQFDRLVVALRKSAPQNRPVLDDSAEHYKHLPFYEAYFSNFIEGTEFTVEDAIAIIYDGAQIPGRSEDSHDLLGTYRVVNDLNEMKTGATSAAEFVELLRARHAIIMAGRPDRNPGMFKMANNRAGDTHFVDHGLVAGTLSAGWERLDELDTAFERAAYTTFLVSEVHPFDDGNGRAARVMMNSEMVISGQSRIIIPTVFREDYLGGLRRLTRQDDPSVMIKALRFAHDYTAQIDFTDREAARAQLEATHAFNEPDSFGPDRLTLPSHLGSGPHIEPGPATGAGRVQRGVPAGGQFKAAQRAPADLSDVDLPDSSDH
jgi:hypothetical protein